jgi:hypothetical protein
MVKRTQGRRTWYGTRELSASLQESLEGSVRLGPVAGIGLLSSGAGKVAPPVGAVCLGIGIGSEIDMIAFLAEGISAYVISAKFMAYIMAVFIFSSGLDPAIMDISFDSAHSYNLALLGFAVLFLAASLLISRLGPYKYPAQTAAAVSEVPSTDFEAQASSAFRTR